MREPLRIRIKFLNNYNWIDAGGVEVSGDMLYRGAMSWRIQS